MEKRGEERIYTIIYAGCVYICMYVRRTYIDIATYSSSQSETRTGFNRLAKIASHLQQGKREVPLNPLLG